jgi:hypothetical protein
MRDSDPILAAATEDQEIVGVGDAASGRVLRHRFVMQALRHGPIPDGQRFLPYVIPRDILPPGSLMEPDDLPREIEEGIEPSISGRDVHAVDRRHPSGHGDPMDFLHHIFVVSEEFVSVQAVREVALIG